MELATQQQSAKADMVLPADPAQEDLAFAAHVNMQRAKMMT